jgi:catechol 2,3-dioxygenase-like lactoylglutathione lyase family enzyme
VIAGVDFIAVPSRDAERSRAFYLDTRGLRDPDDNDPLLHHRDAPHGGQDG